jgi:serine/threonine-protein kinase
MELYCTRPHCSRPNNYFPDLDDLASLKKTQQKYCTTCGMQLVLRERYLPLKLLGQGGFGAAFLARDRDTPRMRECVVKQFQPAGSLTQGALEKAQNLFAQEASVLEDLSNQNDHIPNLYAYFELTVPSWQRTGQDQFFYLVQEYIDGQNLEEELNRKGKFTESEALEVLREILKVLMFVHHKGIIHRDIKPSNIMRQRDGRIFLLDFGAVKQVTGAGAASTEIYSKGFAPPEQIHGSTVFPSTDLYALAVTILVLLTGRQPTDLFDGYTNQWHWRPQVNINPCLADILERMLLHAASQRFQSAQEVLVELEATKIVPKVITATPQTTATVTPGPTPVRPAFPIWELLAGAAFSGYEGALTAIAIYGVAKNPLITLGISFVVLGLLIFAQTRRWIEKWDLLIVSGISMGLIFFVRGNLEMQTVIFLALSASLVAIAMATLARLVYKLLSLFL